MKHRAQKIGSSSRVAARRHPLSYRAAAIIALLGALMLVPGISAAENPRDILIIANKSAPVNSVDVAQIRSIFLGKRQKWPQGGRVVPIHAKKGSRLRVAFSETVLRMSVGQETAYWQAFKIKYGGAEPAEFSNTAKAVFKIRGSVSYVFRAQLRPGVSKVLLVIPAKE